MRWPKGYLALFLLVPCVDVILLFHIVMARVGMLVLVWYCLGSSPTDHNPNLFTWKSLPNYVSCGRSRSKTGATTDIFEIEAIGPLIALLEWPQLLANRPWIHFIDNVGAQQALIRGSSNSLNGDVITGETWTYVRKLGCWLWVERVASASNPIDGVSRKVWQCDPGIPPQHRWSRVRRTKFPDVILKKFISETRGGTVAGCTW